MYLCTYIKVFMYASNCSYCITLLPLNCAYATHDKRQGNGLALVPHLFCLFCQSAATLCLVRFALWLATLVLKIKEKHQFLHSSSFMLMRSDIAAKCLQQSIRRSILIRKHIQRLPIGTSWHRFYRILLPLLCPLPCREN